jgi:hypothetical protein
MSKETAADQRIKENVAAWVKSNDGVRPNLDERGLLAVGPNQGRLKHAVYYRGEIIATESAKTRAHVLASYLHHAVDLRGKSVPDAVADLAGVGGWRLPEGIKGILKAGKDLVAEREDRERAAALQLQADRVHEALQRVPDAEGPFWFGVNEALHTDVLTVKELVRRLGRFTNRQHPALCYVQVADKVARVTDGHRAVRMPTTLPDGYYHGKTGELDTVQGFAPIDAVFKASADTNLHATLDTDTLRTFAKALEELPRPATRLVLSIEGGAVFVQGDLWGDDRGRGANVNVARSIGPRTVVGTHPDYLRKVKAAQFNPRYIVDMLRGAGETLLWGCPASPYDPVQFWHTNGEEHIVMPMR